MGKMEFSFLHVKGILGEGQHPVSTGRSRFRSNLVLDLALSAHGFKEADTSIENSGELGGTVWSI